MIKIYTRISIVASALLLAGVMTGLPAAFAGDDFAAAWDAADAKRKEASTIGYEWRDTGKMLKEAKTEAEAGNKEKAMKLVAKAMEQSADAIAQEARESELWAARVPQ